MEFKNTGIIRRFDDLGRIAIPKEIRRTMQIHEGDPFELGITTLDNGKQALIAVPYAPVDQMPEIRAAIDTLEGKLFGPTCNHAVVALVDYYGRVVNRKERGEALYNLVEEDGRLLFSRETDEECKNPNGHMRTICCKIQRRDDNEPLGVAVLAFSVNLPDETKRTFKTGCALINALLA